VSKLLALKIAKSLGDVADLLNFSPAGLSYVLYKQHPSTKYQKFEIPKKAGGTREICAPIGALKAVQRELATLLNECRTEIHDTTPRRPLSHGFREGLSIITNARNHTGRRFVLNIDLADFFPSLNFGRVRGFFIKDNDFQLNEKVATVLATIACFENKLPQGSPCSPVIADMIAHILDVRLVGLATKYRVTYSRYADDLSFSTNQKFFPPQLAQKSPLVPGSWIAGDKLVEKIEAAGFKVNPEKTRMQFRGSRQIVTGLTVNTKVNISQSYWRGIRSMCRSLYDNGYYHLPKPKAGTPASAPPEILKKLDTLAGMLSHAYHVKQKNSQSTPSTVNPTVPGHADHARFWFFRSFVAPVRPVIICEGKTDNIYLRNAIRQLAVSFPQLGTKTPDGFRFSVALFSYENLVHTILELTGGISSLLKLIHGYRNRLKAYKYRPLDHPVIVVVDNDTALGSKICNALKKHFGVDITHASTAPFFHLTDNLYLVKTPLVGSLSMTCIEDLFDTATLSKNLDGKVFHTEKKDFDPRKHIGKIPFATKIVTPNAATISWKGFEPLLQRFVAVLADYATKGATASTMGPP
jgi:RNA-directed DNA polymerase